MNLEEFEKHVSNNRLNGVNGAEFRPENITVSAEEIKEIWQTLSNLLGQEKQITDFKGYAILLDRIQNLVIKKP